MIAIKEESGLKRSDSPTPLIPVAATT